MTRFDYIVVSLFFLLMVAIGVVSYRKIKGSSDFFVGGGKVPWWLAGISHHVSGYSGVVFVGYAAVAYNHGFVLYTWWAVPIAVGCLAGAFLVAPRWSKLRTVLRIESPTEYLALRYNVPTQQVMAWSGVILKLLDVGAKWASIGILLNGFTGLPLSVGIFVSGGISLLYITIGGLWADLYTDLAQFVVQILAGLVLFFAVVAQLGGAASVLTVWDRLPEGHGDLFNGPFSPAFVGAFFLLSFLSYNGGTWNLAARYIAAPSGASAKRSALLSSALYAFWPLILFFPMWVAPLLLPATVEPQETYAQLTRQFLPVGLVGLVLASMFANTMSMTSSDTNTVSAVLTRDILPRAFSALRNLNERSALRLARLTTFSFTFLTLLVAVEAERFGGILGLIISWFGALIGPVSIPMLFGLWPAFRHAGSRTAILSVAAGLGAFAFTKSFAFGSEAVRVGAPVLASLAVYLLGTLLGRRQAVPERVDGLMRSLDKAV